jgi:hypothetical protein
MQRSVRPMPQATCCEQEINRGFSTSFDEQKTFLNGKYVVRVSSPRPGVVSRRAFSLYDVSPLPHRTVVWRNLAVCCFSESAGKTDGKFRDGPEF